MRNTLLTLFCLLIFPINLFSNNMIQDKLMQGNKLYEKHKYSEAVKIYENIFKSGVKNGYICYNIGTSYLKEGEIGKSLYWYDKAKFFIPLNGSLNKNIQIAISKTKDNFQNKLWINYLYGIFFLDNIFSVKQLFYLTIIFFYILIVISIIRIFIFKTSLKKNLNRAVVILFIFFITFALNFSWQYYNYKFMKTGYVVTDNVKVKNDFNKDANNIMTVNDGAKIIILDEKDNFCYVKFIDNSKGWIEKNKVIY